MVDLREISKIGIGTYKMSICNNEHLETINYAIDKGVNLIDTASNYQFGYSEKLIGSLFPKIDREKVFVISKAGYIQGEDISTFSKILSKSKSIKINNNFLYSIESSFLEAQILASLKRLNSDYLDGFLIHNPEHYFDVENRNKPFIHEHIIEACYFLETLVDKGIIRYYGISSNVLPKNKIELNRILNVNNDLPNFKLAQFPYNLIEDDASKKINEESLISFCKKREIITFANRPLNTRYKEKVLRFADYTNEFINIDFEKEQILFEEFLSLIKKQLAKFGETFTPEDFTPIKFFIEHRKDIANPEAVIKAVNQHLLPFIEQLQFKDAEIKKLINDLLEYWILYSKKSITSRAIELKEFLISSGILSQNDSRNFPLLACENYLKRGVNHVLVGMRKKKYVDNLLGLV